MGVRVGVFGAGGRMGTTVCAAVAGEEGLELVAGVDPHHVGREIEGITIAGDPAALLDAGAEVVVDFTIVDAARENVRWAAEHGVHAVVGTTGFSAEDIDSFEAGFTRSGCILAPNFAIGAVLAIRFAELAAPWFETAEIIELHHDRKRDAPSGTALHTAERMAAASQTWATDPTEQEVLPGARGGKGPAGIRVHAVRMRGMVAHEEIILGTTGQTLTIRHDSYDRTSFMPGVLLAVKKVVGMTGLTVGLDAVLEL